MAKTYRRFSTEFKLGVVEAYLTGEPSLELLREEESLETAQHIAALERKVGQLTMEPPSEDVA